MKKVILGAWIVVFTITITGLALAANKEKAKAVTVTTQVSLEERDIREAKANKILSAKEWIIYVTPIGQKKAKPEADLLTFSGGKITSRNLSAKGYPVSNYTLTLQENGAVIWETVLSGKQSNAFLKGELRGDFMQGSITIQSSRGGVQDFYFMTTQK